MHWKSVSLFPESSEALSSAAVVWTAREILVWGGLRDPGFRYQPSTGAVARISTQGAPSPRRSPYYAWTGNELIVWGGTEALPGCELNLAGCDNKPDLADGARYDPELDRWTPMSTEHHLKPVAEAIAVWTGTELVVWGGVDSEGFSTDRGSRYRPDLDRWIPMSTVGASIARTAAHAVWTSSEVVVWGGSVIDGPHPGGARYDPSTDTWHPISLLGAPEPNNDTVTLVKDQVIVWGGLLGDRSRGARYFPSSDSWAPISEVGMPTPRGDAAAVSTGRRLIVFGGHALTEAGWVTFDDGGAYDPETDSWSPLPAECREPRHGHAGVWIDGGAFFWGGAHGEPPRGSSPKHTGALLVTPP